jgi:hypothetical protein
MHQYLALLSTIPQYLFAKVWWKLLLLISFSFAILIEGENLPSTQAQERPPTAASQNAPPQLKNTLAQVDAAANKRDIKAAMQFYSGNFTHSDGLTRQTLEQALTQLWKRYNTLNYRTELQTWQPSNNGFVAQTVTYITGTQQTQGRKLALTATLNSRQHFQGQKIIRQEILSERSQLTSGQNPPKIELNLPQQVKVGQEYSLDAIVQEPLGDSLLLGAALEEPISPQNYLKEGRVNLEPLSAGGIFKVGRAPAKPTSQWISAILVREDGLILISQRLQVVKP